MSTCTPVSMAGVHPMVAAWSGWSPSTPRPPPGHGYAGTVTVEVSRQGRTGRGATDVVLFTHPANATGNTLYQRIGHLPVTDFTGYRLTQ
ncbi:MULTISPECIES: GNAT family N-acetyltransferase [unclassified Streptomyces]|uniref:GNAT family N-acetyltransferase n=1 Tax=unclassified Streptomyces TaxID=2593676 RepID=UPI004042E9F1